MATEHQKTMIFVPGAWHSPDCFDHLISIVARAGYKTDKVYMPGVLQKGQAPVEGFGEDVAEVRRHIEAAVNAGERVMVVMHSYGGIPGSEAVRDLDAPTLKSQGFQDGRGVYHVFYMCAYLLCAGVAGIDHDLYDGAIPDWITFAEDQKSHICNRPEEILYHDFESPEQAKEWGKALNYWNVTAVFSKQTFEPWTRVPSTYVFCTKDIPIPIHHQIAMVSAARDAGAVDMKMEVLRSSHTPFGSMPEKTAELLLKAATRPPVYPKQTNGNL